MVAEEVQWKRTNESPTAIAFGLGIQKEDRILSICGSGEQAFYLAREEAIVTVVDIDPVQIEYARLRVPLDLEGRIIFIPKDIFRIKGEFDKIYASNAPIELNHSPSRGLRNLARKIRVGGLIYCTRFWERDVNCLTSASLEIDMGLTSVARKYDGDGMWNPTVLRKVV